MDHTFDTLEQDLKEARKVQGRFNMEVESEKAIDRFYDEHVDLNDNRLSNRLHRAKEYSEKFKVLVLPIVIAVLIGILFAISPIFMNYQKRVTIDVMNREWEMAQNKISSIEITEETQEIVDKMNSDYQGTMRKLWIVYIVIFVLIIILILVVTYAPLVILYDRRNRRAYQWQYEQERLEKILEDRRKNEKEKGSK